MTIVRPVPGRVGNVPTNVAKWQPDSAVQKGKGCSNISGMALYSYTFVWSPYKQGHFVAVS
jgi:hypothetical protein